MPNSDSLNMWKVIQGLNCTPDANSPNETISHDGQTITDIKSKANIFINHYARVSKLNMSHPNRDINWQFKKHIDAPSVDNESCAPLQMGELLSAIKKMEGKGAAGPSQVAWPFGPPGITIQVQLIIFTCSLPTNLEGCHNHSIT